MFDVYSHVAFEAKKESVTFEPNLMDGFWSPYPYFGFLHAYAYPEVHVTLDKYDIVTPEKSTTIYNWLQHYDVEPMTNELAGAGFEVEALLGDVAEATFDPKASEFAIVAGTSE